MNVKMCVILGRLHIVCALLVLPMNISMDAKKATNNKSDEVRKKNVFKKDIKKWILEGGVPFR